MYRSDSLVRRRPQLGPAVAAPVGRDVRDEQVRHASEVFRERSGRRLPDRHPPPPPARGTVALAQEARREAEPRPRRARRGGRRPRPRRPHPPEHGRRAARVRARDARAASTRSSISIAPGFGQPRPQPARRGARPPRLRHRRERAARPHVHLARGRLGAHGRAARSRAAVSRWRSSVRPSLWGGRDLRRRGRSAAARSSRRSPSARC